MIPTLTKEFVPNYFTEVRQCAAELVAKWKTKSTGGPLKISPFDELNRLSLEACTLAFHGVKLNCITAAQAHPMIAAMEGATSEAMKRPNRPRLLNWWHQSKFNKDTKTMRTYAADVLKQRRDNPQPERKDMLHALMNGVDPETGERFDDTQLIDEMVTTPIGASTAPCLLSMAMYYLCNNPEAVTRAREEINRVLGDGPFTHDKIADLIYCDAIIKESIRLSAPAPGFNIEPLPGTTGPVTLANGKYEIPADQMMIIVLAAVNRDPAVFDHPLEFRPERMLPEKFEAYPLGVKRWFGNGKRECIGKHYAWLWNVVTIVTILKDVEFEMADSKYQLKQDGWFNVRPAGFEVLVK